MHLVGPLVISLAGSALSVYAGAIPCTDGNGVFLQNESIDPKSLPLLSTVLNSSVYSPPTNVAPTVPSPNDPITFEENIKNGIRKAHQSFTPLQSLSVYIYRIQAVPTDPTAPDTLYKNIVIRFILKPNNIHFLIESGQEWGEWGEPRVNGPPRPLQPGGQYISFFDVSRRLVESEANRLLRTRYDGAFEVLVLEMAANPLQRQRPLQAFYYFIASAQPPKSVYRVGVTDHLVEHYLEGEEACGSFGID